MKVIRILFFLYINTLLVQSQQIELKIDSVTYLDSIPTERKFTINYHIENLTNKEVSLFGYPNNLTPYYRESMAKTITYKIYQEEEIIEFKGIFNSKLRKEFYKNFEAAKTQKEKDSLLHLFLKKEMDFDYQSMITKDEKELLENEKKLVLNSIVSLKPMEKILYTKTLYWDKKRYYKIEDNEYYINEDKPHFIELSINLAKDNYNYNLNAEELNKITGKLNFIQGTFTSNKMEINFN